MASRVGLEPTTYALEERCALQLSYRELTERRKKKYIVYTIDTTINTTTEYTP